MPKTEEMGAVESVKAASDIFAPVSGQITEVNEALGDTPDLLNKSPEDEGRFFGFHLLVELVGS